MSLIKRLIIPFLFFSFVICQGTMNALGVGHFYHHQGIGNATSGVIDLSPSFKSNVSLTNPATWHNLKFTFLSLSYSGNENSFDDGSMANGYSSISNAMWVVPIKSRSSFGINLSPYADQRITMVDQDTSVFQAFDTTYSFTRSFDRSGGILSLRLGTSYNLNKSISFGYFYNILFGSSRNHESLNFDGSSMVQTSRVRYSGIINDVFLLISLTEDLNIFSKYTLTLRALEGALEQKHLFDDINDNGYHDYSPPYYDFPNPDSVDAYSELRIKDLHDPLGYNIGINKALNSNSSVAIELGSLKDNSKGLNSLRLPINNWIKETTTLKASFTHYSNDFSLRLFDRFSFRTGITYYEHKLKNDSPPTTEIGYSLGLGFKFKPVGNQIDINYYIGSREHPGLKIKEMIQQIQLGVSIADIWFVKRRQK